MNSHSKEERCPIRKRVAVLFVGFFILLGVGIVYAETKELDVEIVNNSETKVGEVKDAGWTSLDYVVEDILANRGGSSENSKTAKKKSKKGESSPLNLAIDDALSLEFDFRDHYSAALPTQSTGTNDTFPSLDASGGDGRSSKGGSLDTA